MEVNNPLQPIIDQTFQKIHDIESLLLIRDPLLAGHLQAIHKNLSQYDELVHLLSDAQISQLMAGQLQQTGTVLVAAKTTKASITKQAKGISASDL